MSELTILIDKLVTEKTFSLDALDAIKILRDKATAQDEFIAEMKQQAQQKHADFLAVTKDRDRLFEAEATLAARAFKVSEREEKVTSLEKAAAVAEAKAAALGHCFDTVFRNTVFREMSNRAVANHSNGGYPTTMPETSTRTTEPGQ